MEEVRTNQRLGNEIYLLKEAFCRVSKRLVLLENFIKNKFLDEFPLPSFKIPTGTRFNKNTAPSSVDCSSKSKVTAVTSPAAPNSSRLGNNRQDSNQSSPKRKNLNNPTKSRKVFIIESDSEGQLIDVDDNVIAEEDNHSQNEEAPEQRDIHVTSAVGAEVEIEHHDQEALSSDEDDNSKDKDYKPQDEQPRSPSNEAKIEKTDEHSIRDDASNQSSDTDTQSKKKGTVKRKRKYIPWSQRKLKPRSLTCNICNRVFNGIYASTILKNHMDIHSAVRKYKCTLCDKTFQQKRPLQTHIQRIHQFEKYAVHPCQYCEKKFFTPQEKLRHEQIHTGEKPLTCEICGFSCVQGSNLRRHKQSVHYSKKDVLCSDCGKAFVSNQKLRLHIKKYHESEIGPDGKRLKVVICEICSAALVDAEGLRNHMKRVHGIKPQKPQSLIIVKKDKPGPSTEAIEAVKSIPPD